MHVILYFFITTQSGVILEQGQLWARSCEHAAAFLTDGLRDGQVLHVEACMPVETREARR
jgi:hypothetical protein